MHKAGDAVVFRREGFPISAVALILADGERLEAVGNRWRLKADVAQSIEVAREWMERTHGRVLLWDGSTDGTTLLG